jgi:hypothetical protein
MNVLSLCLGRSLFFKKLVTTYKDTQGCNLEDLSRPEPNHTASVNWKCFENFQLIEAENWKWIKFITFKREI